MEGVKVICINDFTDGGTVVYTKGKFYYSEYVPVIYDPETLNPVFSCLLKDDKGMFRKFYNISSSELNPNREIFKLLVFEDYFIPLEEYRNQQIDSLIYD